MSYDVSKIVPPFDFGAAESLALTERLRVCLDRARELVEITGYQEFVDQPCIPDGATEAEVRQLQTDLGVALPEEYRQFLSLCRYLLIGDGRDIWGISRDDLAVTEKPWVSEAHRHGRRFLVFANYWRYADGDQLMFDLSERDQPVIAYLHEHGPLLEFFAPSFSLALWRWVHEEDDN